MNSSGKFHKSNKRSGNTYDIRMVNQNDYLIGAYSCQCSTNSVAAVEEQSSISTLRVIRDLQRLQRKIGKKKKKKNIHCYIQHSQIPILYDLISWKRKGQVLDLRHRKYKSARWTWRPWKFVRRIYIHLRSIIHRRILGDRKIGSVIELKVVQIIRDHG